VGFAKIAPQIANVKNPTVCALDNIVPHLCFVIVEAYEKV
jgi:hypothetical protein